jgi:RNA polymerase sigma-70 factor (ECF subfamily)
LKTLPDDLKRLVIGHHLGGVSLPVLAEQEGVPVGTLKSRLHRARGMLAAALGRER